MESYVYLDNCATTNMPRDVLKEMIRWCNQGNPSASYPSAVAASTMMENFRKYLTSCYGLTHKIIFNSGASESNSTAIQCICAAYSATGRIPHVVVSAVEHKSILSTIENLGCRGDITYTLVAPTPSGHITVAAVAAAMTSDTALVCVMSANNETGAINDVNAICRLSNNAGAVFHCDMVQTAGKFPLCEFDSASISFHKLHGAPGVGALIIKQELLSGWKICPLIFGSQNSGYRGGTENLPGIGAAFAATKYTMSNRSKKNTAQLALKKYILDKISETFTTLKYTDYVAIQPPKSIHIVVFGDCSRWYLPGVILFSLVAPDVCNAKMKAALLRRNIIVSIGSACNTKSKSSSHVLTALGVGDLKKGTLRVSLGDESTLDDANKFIAGFVDMVNKKEHINVHQ